MSAVASPRRTVVAHLVFVVAFIALWELAMRREWLSAAFFGQPSGIVAYLWDGFATGRKLWLALGLAGLAAVPILDDLQAG